jgi:hypothetical protein
MDMSNIAERLERKFGLGTRPALRKALYERLASLVESEGPSAYRVIAETAVDSEGKTNPGRYFAHVVITRLHERGILAVAEI